MKRFPGIWLFVGLLLIVAAICLSSCGGGSGDTARLGWYGNNGGGGGQQPPTQKKPEVTGIDPENPEAGKKCTIYGRNFGEYDNAVCDVTFGGVSVKLGSMRSIDDWKDTQIEVTIPNTIPPEGDVVVTNAAGSSEPNQNTNFVTKRVWRGVQTLLNGRPSSLVVHVDPRQTHKNDFVFVCVNGNELCSLRYNGVTGKWGAEKRIDAGTGIAPTAPDFALDANGNGICVFEQDGKLYGNYYDAATDTWTGPILRLDETGTNVAEPKIKFYNSADAWIIYVERDTNANKQNGIWAKKYNHSTGWDNASWSAPIRLDWNSGEADYDASQPAVAFDPSGSTGFCVFRKRTGGVPALPSYRTFYARYAGGNWTAGAAGKPIDTAEDPLNGYPTIAMDGNGNAVVVFYDLSDQDREAAEWLSATWYSASEGKWLAPTVIETTGASMGLFNPVAFDNNWNTVTIFQQGYIPGQRLFAEGRTAGDSGTWGTPELIDVTTGKSIWDQSFAFDPAGLRASAVFVRDDGVSRRVYANRYDAATKKWNGPESIDNGISEAYENPVTGVDRDFNVFGFWTDANGVYYNFYH